MSRRILATPAVAALALVFAAAPAGAKELQQTLVCGAAGCTDVTARVPHDESLLQADVIDPGPTRRASFYRIRFGIGDGRGSAQGSWHVLYVPSQGIAGSVDEATGQRIWFRVVGGARSAFRRAVRAIAPLPARRLPLPRAGGERPNGALPPEVVAAPVAPAVADSPGGFALWPVLAVLAAMGGAAALVGGRRSRAARKAPGAPPYTPEG
jgi:hypothetical protein